MSREPKPVSLQCPPSLLHIRLPQGKGKIPGWLSQPCPGAGPMGKGPHTSHLELPHPPCFGSLVGCTGSDSHPSGAGGGAVAEFMKSKDDSSCTGNLVTLIMCLFFPFPASCSLLPPPSPLSSCLLLICFSTFYLLSDLPSARCPLLSSALCPDIALPQQSQLALDGLLASLPRVPHTKKEASTLPASGRTLKQEADLENCWFCPSIPFL